MSTHVSFRGFRGALLLSRAFANPHFPFAQAAQINLHIKVNVRGFFRSSHVELEAWQGKPYCQYTFEAWNWRFWGLENRITPIATSPILSRIPKNDIRLVNTTSTNVIYCCSVCLCTMSLHHEMRYWVGVDDLWCSASTQYMAIVYKCAINYMQHSVYTIRITPCFEFIFSSPRPWILPTLPLPSLESNLPPWFGSLPPSLLPIAPWDLPGGKSPGSRCDTWTPQQKVGVEEQSIKKTIICKDKCIL